MLLAYMCLLCRHGCHFGCLFGMLGVGIYALYDVGKKYYFWQKKGRVLRRHMVLNSIVVLP